MGNIDDQHRNTNMNNKDHLVGQLTRGGEEKDDLIHCSGWFGILTARSKISELFPSFLSPRWWGSPIHLGHRSFLVDNPSHE